MAKKRITFMGTPETRAPYPRSGARDGAYSPNFANHFMHYEINSFAIQNQARHVVTNFIEACFATACGAFVRIAADSRHG
jgi:hypothetical protein